MIFNVTLYSVIEMKGKKVFRFNRNFYILIFAALAVVAITVFIFNGTDKGEISMFYVPEKGGAVILSDGKPTGDVVQGTGISSICYNSDKTYCTVLMAQGTDYSLFGVSSNKVEKTADDCTSNFVQSFSGKECVYLTADGHLYAGDKLISENASSFAVSPDCSKVIYNKDEDDVSKLYLYSGGKSAYVADNYTPVAVTADGNNLYVLSFDNSLCILGQNGAMTSKLCSAVETEKIIFSVDLSSVIFSDGEYTYISSQGKSKTRLIPGTAEPVGQSEYRIGSGGNAVIINDDDLLGLFYGAENYNGTKALFYIDEAYIRTDIADAVKKTVVTGNDTAVYLDSQGKIYEFDGESAVLVISGASDIESSAGNIYYMTSGHGLFVIEGKSTISLASDARQMCMTSSGRLLVVKTDKTLYSVSGSKLGDAIASDVSLCVSDSDMSYYLAAYDSSTGTFDLYSSTDAKKFSLAQENVEQ